MRSPAKTNLYSSGTARPMMPTVSMINEMGFTTFRDSPSRSIPMTAVPETPMAIGTTNNKSKDQIILMDGSFPKNFHLGDSTIAQIESIGVSKVLQSEKYAVEILDTMDVETLKNAKIRTETHEMDVLEALEDETLESHSGVFRRVL